MTNIGNMTMGRRDVNAGIGAIFLAGSLCSGYSVPYGVESLWNYLKDTGVSDEQYLSLKKKVEELSNGNIDDGSFQEIEKQISYSHEYIQNNKQLVYNSLLASFYFIKVLPLFLENKSEEAFALSTPVYAAWYSVSDEKTRQETGKDMKESALFWLPIIGVLSSAGSLFRIDIEAIMEARAKKMYANEYKEIYRNKEVNETLNLLNIVVNPLAKSQSISPDKKRIIITERQFEEILPVLVSSTKLEEIPSMVANFFLTEVNKKKARALSSENFSQFRNYFIEEATRTKVNNLIARTIREKIRALLISAMLTQGILLGNSQASALKDSIYHIADAIKNLGLANGVSVHNAENKRDRFINICIAYLFNRLNYADPAMIVGAYLKGGVKGMGSLLDGLIIANAINIRPFFSLTDEIIYESRVSNEFRTNGKTIENDTTPTEGLSDVVERVADGLSGLRSSDWQASLDNLSPVKNNIVRSSIISLDIEENFYEGDDTLENMFEGLTAIFSNLTLHSKNIQVGNVIFKNYLQILSFLFSHYEKHEDEIRIVLYRNAREIRKVYNTLKNHIYATKKSNTIVENLQKVLAPEHDYTKENQDEEPVFEMVLARYEQDKKAEDINLSDLITVFDIDFVMYKGNKVFGSIVGVAKFISTNIRFLMYVKNKRGIENLSYTYFLETFKENFSLLYSQEKSSRYDFIEMELISIISREEIDYLNEIFSDKEYLTLTERKIESAGEEEKVKGRVKKIMSSSFLGYTKLLEMVYGKDFQKIQDLFALGENYAGRENFESFKMILLIQGPYMTAIVNSITDIIHDLDKNGRMPEETKKIIILMVVSILSSYTKNYISMMVGVELMQKILGLSPEDAIREVGKIAVMGGGNVTTGKTENTILATRKKRMNITELRSREHMEKIAIGVFGGTREWRDIKKSIERVSKIMGIADPMLDALLISLLPSISEIYSSEKIINKDSTSAILVALQQDQIKNWSNTIQQFVFYAIHPIYTTRNFQGKITSLLGK